jgi:hypothetical protein
MKDDYIVKIALTLNIKDVYENEVEDYLNDFIIGLNSFVSSDDPEDDHYEINDWRIII